MIDTRTVVTRGKGSAFKRFQGDINKTDTLYRTVGGTCHGSIQIPKSRNMHISVPCPCIGHYSGSTHVKRDFLTLSSQSRSYWPGIRPHEPLGIRAVSNGSSGECITITVYRQELGFSKLWIKWSAGTAWILTYRAGDGFESVSEYQCLLSQILREFSRQGPENTPAIVALEYPNPPSLATGGLWRSTVEIETLQSP